MRVFTKTSFLQFLLIEVIFVFQLSFQCKVNEINFLDKCFCEPGWESKSTEVLDCTLPILENGGCDCEPLDLERNFLKNESWFHHSMDYRCNGLCKWNSQVGTARSHVGEWKDNQVWRQLGFYRRDLPVSVNRANHLTFRLLEFANAYSNFYYLNHTDLGSVIEFGAGGYTQLRNIMERVEVTISDVTLVDTQIYDYKVIQGCTYYSGQFVANGRSYPTILSNLSVEQFSRQPVRMKQYDTVICMNVLVYALDAFQFLQTLYEAVRPGGMLIFHDRWFENSALSSRCKTAGYTINVVQVCKPLLEHFMSKFDQMPFLTTNMTTDQKHRASSWCHGLDTEPAYWAVVTKPK